eukprot:GHRQ01035886.1.p1 GENE.GHRQ01035886.1~~GHRQ01035886.1.p1  ORF type:complete len:128 (-),score=25.29 GHRQ01035886.1:389-772(-)
MAALTLLPHLLHVKAISTMSGCTWLMRVTVPRSVASLPAAVRSGEHSELLRNGKLTTLCQSVLQSNSCRSARRPAAGEPHHSTIVPVHRTKPQPEPSRAKLTAAWQRRACAGTGLLAATSKATPSAA